MYKPRQSYYLSKKEPAVQGGWHAEVKNEQNNKESDVGDDEKKNVNTHADLWVIVAVATPLWKKQVEEQ